MTQGSRLKELNTCSLISYFSGTEREVKEWSVLSGALACECQGCGNTSHHDLFTLRRSENGAACEGGERGKGWC